MDFETRMDALMIPPQEPESQNPITADCTANCSKHAVEAVPVTVAATRGRVLIDVDTVGLALAPKAALRLAWRLLVASLRAWP
jgi:hypothetical protein